MNSLSSIRQMRVCVVTETYPPDVNGVAMTVRHLVNGLLARGHQVQLVRPRMQPQERPQREGRLEIVPQPAFTLPFYPQVKLGLPVGRVLKRLWREHPPDVVHIVTEGPLGESALRSAKHLNIPVSSSFHTNFHSYSQHYGFGVLAQLIVRYLRLFHNRTACTFVATEELAERLQALGFVNIRILARGVETRLFSPERRCMRLRQQWGVEPDDPVVLYVGRLAAEKNLDLAIAAFRAIQQDCARARFVLVGDGPMESVLRSRYPDMIFCGVRQGEDLATHYASADIFLFPSLTETFGNVTLEAMASGLAVVAFDYAAARRHLEHEHSGLRIPLGSASAFIEAARHLARNPNRIRRFGREARRAVEAFSWDRIHERLERTFLELAPHRGPQ